MKSFLPWARTTYRQWVINHRQSRLMKYYERKNYESIPKLFKDHLDYSQITLDGLPFTFYLISQGNKQALEIFLNNIKFRDSLPLDDNNPVKCNMLVFAYLQDKPQIAQVLENHGFFVGVLNAESQNLLHLATIYRRRQAFMAGLSKKINHDQADDLGNTPLHYACRTAQIELIEALLAGKASKIANNSHMYPIHMAIESLSMPAVQLLKNDLWLRYPMFHPIHSAARVGFIDVMKEILAKDSTLVNIKDNKRLTPLHHAIATENGQSLDFLLRQNEIIVDQTDEYGNTPLHIAFMRDDVDSAAKLVNAKASLDILNHDHLAPVDLGLDSASQRTKSYLKTITMKSQRLRQYSSDN